MVSQKWRCHSERTKQPIARQETLVRGHVGKLSSAYYSYSLRANSVLYRRQLAVVAAKNESSGTKKNRKHMRVGRKCSFVDTDLKNNDAMISKKIAGDLNFGAKLSAYPGQVETAQ